MDDTMTDTGHTDDRQDGYNRTQNEKSREATLKLTDNLVQLYRQCKASRQYTEIEIKADELFMNGDNHTADVTISCQEKTWGAHALILAARCPFFRACLKSGCKEAITARIELGDDNPEACEIFLEYLYTQNLIQQPAFYVHTEPNKPERLLDVNILVELCKMAHKYGVPGLFTSMANLIRPQISGNTKFKDYVSNLFGAIAYLFLNTTKYDDCTEMLYLQGAMLEIMNLQYTRHKPLSAENRAMLAQNQDLITCIYFMMVPAQISKLLLSSNQKALEN